MSKAWQHVIAAPLEGRSIKPRETGLTMVIDKHMGIHRLRDLIQSAGDYIDVVKLTFGTSAFYDEDFLIQKNSLLTASGIDVMPGGTFCEVAIWQGRLEAYLIRAGQLGFSAVEVSDGTISMHLKTRDETIKRAREAGFKVYTEVGKKDPQEALPWGEIHRLIERDRASGAFKVIIEAREAGKGVGIFDLDGKIKQDDLNSLLSGLDDPDLIMWEAPIKNQQQTLILRVGNNVNLGNIPPDEILALEAMRQGLRGDTLKQAYLADRGWSRDAS